MKRKSVFGLSAAVSAFLCAAVYILSVPVYADDAEDKLRSVNYGTPDNMVFGEKGIAIVSVTDDEGNSDDEVKLCIYNENNEKLAGWNGNDINSFRRTRGSIELINDKSLVNVYGSQLPDFTGGKGYTRVLETRRGTNTNYSFYPDSWGFFEYSASYPSVCRYVTYGDTEFTVPAGSFGAYAEKGWSSRAVNWFFRIGRYEDPDDEYSSLLTVDDFLFNKIDGKIDIRKFDDGDYPFRIGYSSSGGGGGSGNIHNRIHINEKSYEYARKTINLHDVYPSYFNEDGTKTDKYGGADFNFARDTMSPFKTAGAFFISGNFVNAPLPDENGNVTIYVNKNDYKFTMVTDFGWANGGGGGTTGMTGFADEKCDFEFKTVDIPENSIPLKGLAEGTYTVLLDSLPEKYEIPADTSVSFTVTNKPGSGVPECSIVLKTRKYALNLKKSRNGKIVSDAKDNAAVPVESKVKLTFDAEEGYRPSGLVFCSDSGERIPADFISFSDNSFEMPYGDLTVEASFAPIMAGDVDGDGSISSADLLHAARIIQGAESDPYFVKASDINGDGRVNVFDYLRMVRSLVSGSEDYS